MYNNEGTCVLTCPGNTIIDNVLYKCYQCDIHCSSCKIYTNNCMTCDSGYSLYNNSGTINNTCLT